MEFLSPGYASLTFQVPDTMSSYDWLQLLNIENEERRKKHYEVLCKRKEILVGVEDELESVQEQHQQDSDGDSNCFIDPLLYADKLPNEWKYIQSLMFGNPVIIDIDKSPLYSRAKYIGMAQSLLQCSDVNTAHPEPFHLHFPGLELNSPMLNSIRNIMTAEKMQFLLKYSEMPKGRNFSESFPSDRLVFISQQSKHELKYDADDIYVLNHESGCYWVPSPYGDNIRTAALPLKNYLHLR